MDGGLGRPSAQRRFMCPTSRPFKARSWDATRAARWLWNLRDSSAPFPFEREWLNARRQVSKTVPITVTVSFNVKGIGTY
jgi:hypothetical protein